MSKANQNTQDTKNRWLRWALLAYTLTSPAINAALERIRRQSQSLRGTVQAQQEKASSMQTRLDDLTAESRQRVFQQVKRLRLQARQLEEQSRQLRKAVREEARQRRKLVKEMSKSGIDWSQDLLKQGGQFTEGIVERGGKILGDVVEIGGRATQDVAERSGQVTRDLAKRGKTATRDVLERGEDLLQPVRQQGGRFWTLVGFGTGLLAATIITYRLVRRRVALQELEENQSIELPQSDIWNGTGGEVSRDQPAGEIRRVDDIGTAVATELIIEVEDMLASPEAAFVGIVSTRFYYPIEASLDGVEDLIYFGSEEDAQAQGFTRAENS